DGRTEPKSVAEISPWLIRATIGAEDHSFYDKPGVNFRGLARAAVENLAPFGPGFLKGTGGSSITQQLVKNVYIEGGSKGTAPRTVDRKIKETVIALELKRKFDDNQILEWYLNQIYFGSGDRKSTRLNSSHVSISYAVFCLKKKKRAQRKTYAARARDR